MRTARDIIESKVRPVCGIDRNASVLDATVQFCKMGVGATVITDGDKVIGIFTERDLCTKVVTKGLDPTSQPVGEVMTAPVVCCRPETSQGECVAVMIEKHIRHLPVVDEGSKLLGMISIRDLLIQEMDDRANTIRHLNEYMFTR